MNRTLDGRAYWRANTGKYSGTIVTRGGDATSSQIIFGNPMGGGLPHIGRLGLI